ncbi:MAG: GIY-YIG nuclease family protein [Sandaracinaceae bacterium]|nr:GIY-YIG nuclease family protein [Sandaracinaceae bacterium]
MPNIELADVLRTYGLDVRAARTKIVRHVDPKYRLDNLGEHMHVYESVQSRPVFQGCQYVVSCLGEERMRSRLLWVKRVVGEDTPPRAWPPGFPHPDMQIGGRCYRLERCKGFEMLEGRVIVDWGESTRSWHQWLGAEGKPVIEILPSGFVRSFPGYDDVLLTHTELRAIVANPDGNRVWHDRLSNVSAIYLIAHAPSRRLYIGSASGAGGLMHRWSAYAKNGHGGNKLLRAILAERDDAPHEFAYSILRVLPQATSRDELLAIERVFKRKLGDRAFDLNAN